MNFSAVTSTPKSITTAVDQTLTCTISGLDTSYPVTVTWKDPNGAAVLNSDTNNYAMSPGTVDSSGNQIAVLTIKAAKLADYASSTALTYKCLVKSSQYASSPESGDVDVVANVLTLSKCIPNNLYCVSDFPSRE